MKIENVAKAHSNDLPCLKKRFKDNANHEVVMMIRVCNFNCSNAG